MDYVRFSISNPVKVSVVVMMLMLFGFISLFTIPIQLVPNVDQPIITVTTEWTGQSPEEVEREVLEEQENKLKIETAEAKKEQSKAKRAREIIVRI